MSSGRIAHTATLLASGKVLVTGGAGGEASTELYDPTTNTWSRRAAMGIGRTAHTATLLASGKVLVSGGVTTDFSAVASAELYDPATNAWSPAASTGISRAYHTATSLAGGRVLVTGGATYSSFSFHQAASAELYNPASNTWSAAASMSTPRGGHTATLLLEGKVLVTGSTSQGVTAATAELYDPHSDTWELTASMSSARIGHAATLLEDGKVLVTGGFDDTGPTASAELYTAVAVAPAPRAVGDAYSVNLDASLVVSAPGVLRNDRDPNGDALRAVLVSRPAHGTLTLNADGRCAVRRSRTTSARTRFATRRRMARASRPRRRSA